MHDSHQLVNAHFELLMLHVNHPVLSDTLVFAPNVKTIDHWKIVEWSGIIGYISVDTERYASWST